MAFKMSRSRRLMLVIAVSLSFFLAEISVGFYTHSLALVADAFHYLNDLVGFVVALVALKISATTDSPKALSFGWQRAQLLGAFFNGVFLLALGISIFLQSVERFVSLQYVENPKLIFMVGCVGLGLNLISALFLHGKPVAKGRDLGMMGVLLHVLGDAANNLGVIISALVIWLTHYEGRYYADPAVSMAIAVTILLSSLPLVRRSGVILLESAPNGVDLGDVKHDLEKIPGVVSIHELHVWRLNQQKSLASVHVVISDRSISSFHKLAKTINECFHAYGIHSATLQPELSAAAAAADGENEGAQPQSLRQRQAAKCQMPCGTLCEELTCCG
ncbi:cation diffusion facilitator family metal ion transporter [Thermoascus aurantiacus ATCC 26904]